MTTTPVTFITLFDITATGVTRGESLARDQQRNWETVLQLLGLRTQVIVEHPPVKFVNEDLNNFDFGEFYQGHQAVWAMQFRSEHTDIYNVLELEQDFDQIPLNTGLTETAGFLLPIVQTSGVLKNAYFLEGNWLNILS
jgi:hypothetical protein